MFIIFTLILVPGIEGESESPQGPSQVINMVEVEIEESSIPIDTSFNGSFEGTLHCGATLILNFGIFVESVDVFLSVEFPEEISVTLTDYEFTLTPDRPYHEFVANVTVDPGTSSYLDPNIIIGGSARASPSGTRGGVIEDSAQVDILPFYTAEISFVNDAGTMNKGEEKTFKLLIENRGNADEAFIIATANGDELRQKDVELEYESRVELQEGGKMEMDVVVKTGDKTTRGPCMIRMEIWSERNGPANKEDSNAVLVVDIQDPYIESIQSLLSRSPWMVYIAIAVVVIIIVMGIYLLLRLRARRAWKKRLKRYQEYGQHQETETVEAVVEEEPQRADAVQFQISSR